MDTNNKFTPLRVVLVAVGIVFIVIPLAAIGAVIFYLRSLASRKASATS